MIYYQHFFYGESKLKHIESKNWMFLLKHMHDGKNLCLFHTKYNSRFSLLTKQSYIKHRPKMHCSFYTTYYTKSITVGLEEFPLSTRHFPIAVARPRWQLYLLALHVAPSPMHSMGLHSPLPPLP